MSWNLCSSLCHFGIQWNDTFWYPNFIWTTSWTSNLARSNSTTIYPVVYTVYYLELKLQWVKCCLLLVMNLNKLHETTYEIHIQFWEHTPSDVDDSCSLYIHQIVQQVHDEFLLDFYSWCLSSSLRYHICMHSILKLFWLLQEVLHTPCCFVLTIF